MQKKILISLLTIVCILGISGCSNKTDTPSNDVVPTKVPTPTPTPADVEGNTRVAYLLFYAPNDYTYRPDLRGLAYDENNKKVYIKGDYENDSANVIYIITALEFQNKNVDQYIEEVNTKLADKDVKFVLKNNSKNTKVYARESYVIGNNINYAYILGKSGDIYVVNVKGPQDKTSEIAELASNVFKSLYIS